MERKTEPSRFEVRAPIYAVGGGRHFLVESDICRVAITSGAAKHPDGRPRGEDEIHTHPTEDHTFVVMHGSARFFFPDRDDIVLSDWEGIFLPRGCYYAFVAEGEESLVMMRFGALAEPLPANGQERIDPYGRPLERDLPAALTGPGRDIPRGLMGPREPVPGKFFPR